MSIDLVVVGGGTAGWLAASLIASKARSIGLAERLRITLVESADIPTVGVGEGTWPSMRSTLEQIGISEVEFLSACGASFKQGSEFRGWMVDGNHSYMHPFTPPVRYGQLDLYSMWKSSGSAKNYAEFTSLQARVCSQSLAPKQRSTPEYAGVLNYGYHLDAVAFAGLLSDHAIKTLGVRHVTGTISSVKSGQDGSICAVVAADGCEILGDLFIDCSGRNSVLMKQHFGIRDCDFSKYLFNDSAIAAHIPVGPECDIRSTTVATAWSNGWIWDIGLQRRRGVGIVYSKAHASEDEAHQRLADYVLSTSGSRIEDLSPRAIGFESGYLEKLWHKNCVAVGMAAGFIEPLEASAIAMIELASNWICSELPLKVENFPILEKRFNERFTYRWEKILTFLKLHYVISDRRDSAYWRDATSVETLSSELKELLMLWKGRPPCYQDFIHNEEVFPSASYQYVLYGMGFNTAHRPIEDDRIINEYEKEIVRKVRQLESALPKNRSILSF